MMPTKVKNSVLSVAAVVLVLSKFESMLLMCLTKAFKSHYSHDFHLRWGGGGFQQEEYTLKREIRPRSKQVALQCRQIGFEMVFFNTTLLLMDFMGNLDNLEARTERIFRVEFWFYIIIYSPQLSPNKYEPEILTLTYLFWNIEKYVPIFDKI